MHETQNPSPREGFAELKTAGGVGYIRTADVQAVLPTGINQCTVVLRGGAAAGMNFPAREIAAALNITEAAAPPALKLVE